ncbi:MAG: hypothetical protein LIO76_06915 [Clostridiales bacterium]|nr:hypothetical protein [Clostridiales bacterium]
MRVRNNKVLFQSAKTVGKDTIWTISAMVLMNVVVQFLIYPLWSRIFGDEIYGEIVYAMSIVNVFATSIGVGVNYARMKDSTANSAKSCDYNGMLLLLSLCAMAISYVILFFSSLELSFVDIFLTGILCFVTIWRYYSDVEFRLNLDYKGYFKYYFAISVGYGIGLIIFMLTRRWPLALLPGEIAGLIYIATKTHIFQSIKSDKDKKTFSIIVKTALTLVATNFIANLIFNGDRILLQNILGGAAVTTYYIASLTGKTMSLITTPLNSVLIGYLSRYEAKISRKIVIIFSIVTLGAIAGATCVGVVGSHILIKLLYPGNYEAVKPYLVAANLAQVIYFMTNIVTTFLLRIADTRFQVVVNITYMVLFIVLCIPATLNGGVWGFCVALLIVNFLRYMLALILCFVGESRMNK